MKIYFKNDYSEGAHPRILEALVRNNSIQEEGYGLDSHSLNAARLLREMMRAPDADIHFLSGGTQTNLIAISAFLRPHEACICAKSGHVATHETGAIEATGHKLLPVESGDGKLSPDQISPVLEEHFFEHMVKPAMVYISNPTELGTVYSLEELEALHTYCAEKELFLYLDGARLGCALQVEKGLSLEAIYRLTNAFFIGGTKIGALLGEALVIRDLPAKKDARYIIKQRGGLLAKGRVLGIQFEELFRDALYFELAAHANAMAQDLFTRLQEGGCAFLLASPTNQIFPIFPDSVIAELEKNFDFYVWSRVDEEHSAVRLVTSWATKAEAVRAFIESWQRLARDTSA